jgi:long-chain acyl-CoA synthetase
LHITGRRKQVLVLSNGKKIGCALVERALERSSVIQNAFVAGEGRNFVTALIVPNLRNLSRMARDSGIQFADTAELLRLPAVWSLIRQEIEAQQAEFSNFERVRRFSFLHEDALLDPELVTPTQKIRSNVLERQYGSWIAQMYLQEDPLVISPSDALAATQSAAV